MTVIDLEANTVTCPNKVVASFRPNKHGDAIAYFGDACHDCPLRGQCTNARTGRTVSYTTLDVEGPPHERSFTAAAVIGEEIVGTGVGRSKKDAEQQAAREALAAFNGPRPS